MLKNEIAQKILDKSLSLGADFADIFIEKCFNNSIRLLDSKINEISNRIDFEIGIRLIYGTKVLYGYTNSKSEEELLRITPLLTKNNKKNQRLILFL